MAFTMNQALRQTETGFVYRPVSQDETLWAGQDGIVYQSYRTEFRKADRSYRSGWRAVRADNRHLPALKEYLSQPHPV